MILPFADQTLRTIAFTFRIDTYMSMLSCRAPTICCDELDVGLTCTFSTFNAHGLDIFFVRHPQEPPERSKYRLSELCGSTPPFLDSGLLIEDIQTGLCGIWPSVWRLSTECRRGRISSDESLNGREMIERQLGCWKLQLDGLTRISDSPESHPQSFEVLLRSYAGKETPLDDDYQDKVIKRVVTCLFNCRMLYHLLCLHLYTDMTGTLDVSERLGLTTATQPSGREVLVPNNTGNRQALLHAMLALEAYEVAARYTDMSGRSLDAIAHLALAVGAEVVCELLSGSSEPCRCGTRMAPDVIDLAFEKTSSVGFCTIVERWVSTGGPVAFNGISICSCRADVWAARFANALQRGSEPWEFGSRAVEMLRRRMGTLMT